MNEPKNFKGLETTSAIPDPSSMIETFRAIGYNIESAIADIVDNSITAEAKNIWIDFEWKGESTCLSIKDDGIGMDSNELIQAMRPGSINPLVERSVDDLGRFGLGLKTASFSQCRQLTVYSKIKEEQIVQWSWDLDYVQFAGKWELIKFPNDSYFDEQLQILRSGTIVVWNEMDRVVKDLRKDDDKALEKYLRIMEKVKNHLSIVFHRFLESKKVKIFFCKREIEPWDPFLQNEPATQVMEDEFISNGKVKIKGFVLPHKSRISNDVLKKAEGIKGWNGHQGFYVYRSDRLILAGDWLGMFRKEEHYKLARIAIYLPNSFDIDWKIDIKKSVASPPLKYREYIRAYALKVRAQAVEVYRHRGTTIKSTNGVQFVNLWLPHRRGDKWFHKINRDHPIVVNSIKQSETEPQKAFETLLRFIEETIPTKSIYIKEAEEPEAQGKPFEDTNQDIIFKNMKLIYENLVNIGKSKEDSLVIISNIEPFNHFRHLFEMLK